MTRCRWVDSRKAEGFPVTMACTVAGVSTTTFYDWLAAAQRGPRHASWTRRIWSIRSTMHTEPRTAPTAHRGSRRCCDAPGSRSITSGSSG